MTIRLDETLEYKVRNLQSELIATTHKNWSYSSVASLLLKNGLKKFSKRN